MITLQKPSEAQAALLTEIGRRTYLQTYGHLINPQSVAQHLDKTFQPEIQLAEINDPRRMIEIACLGTEAVGYLHLVEETPPPGIGKERTLKLQRIYVDTRWQGKKVGLMLMNRCAEIGRENNFKTLWLSVWKKNHRAQAFYKKHGFFAVGEELFTVGDIQEQNDILLRTL